MNLISIKNLKKSFKTQFIETFAINDISFNIKQGEFTAITGPSGCGKSTLLSVLGLLEYADEGEYHLCSKDIIQLTASQRAEVRNHHIGFIFQSFNLIAELSTLDNVALPLKLRGVAKQEYIDLAYQALQKVGLGERAKHFPPQLSGGQQQRAAIARAIITNPDIILADEPTGNLDSENSKIVIDILLQLNKSGKTIVIVTHDQALANLAQKQLTMCDGQLIN
ncbi:ABC transporter ATP-binding protein [Pseudoalteromonas tunicata]|jgi:putative ABC transport system ATP-binding protein|uniref:Putative ABC transport system, ATP-binding protein n=1 Tax=Pseudoalteromonas tunicata D2 TaxID=87626 RepID=A4CDW2_9GAMM|nr:ABC transporter ATP-binding protein [Pseudoalteromonas tunicata]EAR27154.1 putative ABC transport system, ATP-binding protein [Pseudoalteromonas tunicata D2]